MHRKRHFIVLSAAMATVAWAAACGDGGTEPPAPPPDPPRATTVTVTPATAELTALGETVQLRAEVRDQNGQAMAGAAVSWASSSAAVATVSAAGLVTAASNGRASITATAGSASGSATVTVAQEVSAVAVSPAADTLVAGDTLRLTAEAADANGHTVGGAEFTWASSDTLVAVVDDSGLVTGVGAGEAEIAATASSVRGRAEIAVLEPAPTTVAVEPDTLALTALGQTAQLAAEVRDQAGRVMAGVPVSWSSADTLVAMVDSVGLVTATGGGGTTVTATAGEASDETVVTVMQSAGSVLVTPPVDSVTFGDTLRLVAEAFDETGHLVEGAQFTWSSSDPSVATVDGSGLVTGVVEGAVTITATTGNAQGTARITVVNPDRAALLALYRATDGPNWVNNDKWLTDAPLRAWYGVDTDASGRVVRLRLSGSFDFEWQRTVSHGLSGPIPAELAGLSNLELLDLSYNNLSGPIPTELAGLSILRGLSLAFNALSGPIPAELAGLSNLVLLKLSNNALSGPIPPELGDLASLSALRLSGNNLSSAIPPELGSLAKLTDLNLVGNELTGSIPPALGDLAELQGLSLAFNALSGPIPPELSNLAKLSVLLLDYNALSGPIPKGFLGLDGLSWFRFHRNAGLCAPGTLAFVTWLAAINGGGPYCNELDAAALDALYQMSGGPDWTISDGWLDTPVLDEWHGVTADSLGRVVTLDLTDNGLTGPLPSELGNLREMTRLRIGDNALAGRLPLSLAHLSLVDFRYTETGLCTPAEAEFRTWLNGIPSHAGPGVECAAISDRDILVALYNATGGPGWYRSDHWLTDSPLGSWHGVSVDAEGRVVRLDLNSNSLVGSIPAELGKLSGLTLLNFNSSNLTGPIPPELGALTNLRELSLYNTSIVGPIPPELGELVNLERLEIGHIHNLSGGIPAELGNLANLRYLGLFETRLTGSIPPEFGNLANLERLSLFDNDLTGPLPSELGNLANLQVIDLWNNRLTGPIPPELGDLTGLRTLSLADNQLTGPLPQELGNLTSLLTLGLADNQLMGSLPPELGNLTGLLTLSLANNNLAGPLPPEFVRMSSLRELALGNNRGLAGALPSRLTDLSRLERLLAGGTSLCAPSDPGFQAWLGGIHKRRIAPCLTGDRPIAYLTQAVQSRDFPVPLVADEKALLRVFVTARKATSKGIPPVRARFYVRGQEVHVVELPGSSAQIPTEVSEGSLSKSANAEIPGHVIQPGLEMVIEVDPDGTLDPELGVPQRIPETGRMAVDVWEMPLLDLTVIPFLLTADPDAAIIDLTVGMATDPEGDDLLKDTRTLLPVASLEVLSHEPVLISVYNPEALLRATAAIRFMEGGVGHYLGMMSETTWGAPAGIAYAPGRSSVATPSARVIAHELGHNLSLFHAPCGSPDRPDPSFPYPHGSTGAFGYDFSVGGELVSPSHGDLMSYCEPGWISDYHFTNALRYRLFDEGAPTAVAVAAKSRSLLLWGGIGTDSVPFLDPAFVVDAPAALPDSAGEFRLTGRTDSGADLFSLSFGMPEVADGDGSSGFAFVLPVQSAWEGDLASISLTGPGGSVTLDGDTDLPMAILRNPRTRQIRGIISNPPLETQAAADAGAALAPGLEVLLSRGIPDTAAWRR